jgi:hypothetical protein
VFQRFNWFVEAHTVLFYALVVVMLVLVGLVVDGNPLSALGYALGNALQPMGEMP